MDGAGAQAFKQLPASTFVDKTQYLARFHHATLQGRQAFLCDPDLFKALQFGQEFYLPDSDAL